MEKALRTLTNLLKINQVQKVKQSNRPKNNQLLLKVKKPNNLKDSEDPKGYETNYECSFLSKFYKK